ELHGGTVSAASAGEGRGCEVTVRLPRRPPVAAPPADAATPLPPPPPAEPAAPPPLQGGRRVLVVDDNAHAALSIAVLRGLWGHEAHTACDGLQALDLALALAPDVVLLDLGLPGLDGCEVARRLRAAGSQSLLIALTGYGHDDDRARSRAAGFDRHL